MTSTTHGWLAVPRGHRTVRLAGPAFLAAALLLPVGLVDADPASPAAAPPLPPVVAEAGAIDTVEADTAEAGAIDSGTVDVGSVVLGGRQESPGKRPRTGLFPARGGQRPLQTLEALGPAQRRALRRWHKMIFSNPHAAPSKVSRGSP